MSEYLPVFIEAVLSTLWPMLNEISAYAMLYFGGFDMNVVAAACSLGVLAATFILWVVGRVTYEFYVRYAPETMQQKHQKLHDDMRKHGAYMSLVIWLPIGFCIAFACGFLRLPLNAVLPLSLIGAIGFYSYQFLA